MSKQGANMDKVCNVTVSKYRTKL